MSNKFNYYQLYYCLFLFLDFTLQEKCCHLIAACKITSVYSQKNCLSWIFLMYLVN